MCFKTVVSSLLPDERPLQGLVCSGLVNPPAAGIPPPLIIIFSNQGRPDSSAGAKVRSRFAPTRQTSECFCAAPNVASQHKWEFTSFEEVKTAVCIDLHLKLPELLLPQEHTRYNEQKGASAHTPARHLGRNHLGMMVPPHLTGFCHFLSLSLISSHVLQC